MNEPNLDELDEGPPIEEELIDKEEYGHDEEQGEEQADRLRQGLIQALEDKKELAVQHKLIIEAKWIEDERQYWGFRQADIDEEAGDGDEQAPPVDNKTGEKVELAAARIGDMLFPTNDPNWALKPPSRPEDVFGQPVEMDVARKATKTPSSRASTSSQRVRSSVAR